MQKILIPLIVASLVALNGCGSSLRVFSDIDDSGQFDLYSTYSFMDFTDGNKKTITGMELERIRVAFARELEHRGLKFIEQDGEVSVRIVVYHRQAMDGHFGYPGRYNYMERAIAVDLYDNATMKHIWHCAAVGELVYDPDRRTENLYEVVAEIFERYPVQPVAGI